MSVQTWTLPANSFSDDALSPEAVEIRLRDARLMAARLQLLISSALVWLIFVFGAAAGGIPPLVPTLLLGAWIIASTLWLSLIALRSRPETLFGNAPGRIALLCTLITVILATLLVRDTAGDFYLIYFFPIAVATIYYGIRGGFATAFLCALSYVFLGVMTRDASFSIAFVSVLAARIVLLFAMAGTIGVSAEGQLALIRELEHAYGDLKLTTRRLQHTERDLTRLYQEAITLERVAQQLTASLEPEEVLHTALEQVETLLNAEASTLMVLDAPRNELVFEFLRGSEAETLRGYRLPIGQGVAGWVALHQMPLRVDDTGREPRFTQVVDQQSGFHTRSLLAVPMVFQGRVTGVLEVINKRRGAFTNEDERVLSGVARWSATALENARLYQELQGSMEALQKAQQELVRSERLRALGEMAGGVAHDFNNLLTVILAESQVLESKARDVEDRAALYRIAQAARDGARSVRRIQEYSRIRRDSPRELVDVNLILREVAAVTRPRWAPFGNLQLELAESARIKGSSAELREALMNLIFNASEARRDKQNLEIVLRSYQDRDWVVIEVQDNGTGIPTELKSRIFDPYFTTKPQAAGLGLSVTYGLISRHGGEITVTSPLPSAASTRPSGADAPPYSGHLPYGTRITLRLPPARQAPEEIQRMPRSANMARTVQILFVDDDPNILSAARSLLGALGQQVVTAQTRADAEARIDAGHYDVLMTDLKMPDGSGWDLAKRSKELFPDKPVVLVTGWGLTLEPEQLKAGQVNGVLAKPFTLEELERTMRQLEL